MSAVLAKLPTVGRRSGVVVRADVRRDSNGFEDPDDFWEDDATDNDVQIQRSRPGLGKAKEHLKKTTLPLKPSIQHTPQRTPRKTNEQVPDARRNSDGFEDEHEFWVQADSSTNDSSTSDLGIETSFQFSASKNKGTRENAAPHSTKKHTHLNRRQRRQGSGNAAPSIENIPSADADVAAEHPSVSLTTTTPPFARRSKFPSTMITQPSTVSTSNTHKESLPANQTPEVREQQSVFSFSDVSSPASTVKSRDAVSPVNTPLSHTTSPIARGSPMKPYARNNSISGGMLSPFSNGRQSSPGRREKSNSPEKKNYPSVMAKQVLGTRAKHDDKRERQPNRHKTSSPDLDKRQDSVSGVSFNQEDSLPPSYIPSPPSPMNRESIASDAVNEVRLSYIDTPPKAKGLQRYLKVSEELSQSSPKKGQSREKRVAAEDDFEFGMPEDDRDPFQGNLSPISPTENHSIGTPPPTVKKTMTKQKTKDPVTKKVKTKYVESFDANESPIKKPKNTKTKPRNKKRESYEDESSFALTDRSRMGSDSEAENNITVLSHAGDVLRDASDSDSGGVRRSKRRRIKPLEWYKCERPVYERRQSGVGLILPTISHIERASTSTPVKRQHKQGKSKSAPFPLNELPSEFSYLATDSGELWDELTNKSSKMRMICRNKASEIFALPGVDDYPCGFAGQTFNLPGGPALPTWISGRLVLPPQAVKQPESVGNCTQVFVVMSCQPGSLEVAYGHPSEGVYDEETAQRYLLSPGDEYFVPPENAYFLRNHSKTVEAEVRFMILKPTRQQLAAVSSGKKKPRVN
ncbi:hypothetical protein Ae201684P_002958 [Aphanomyces euteiches]|nr:hypothetical protein Ae201684P_002958 [Aphanomyces euteiches]